MDGIYPSHVEGGCEVRVTLVLLELMMELMARADRVGVTVEGTNGERCDANSNPVSEGFNPWPGRIPAIGTVITVTCADWDPDTTGFRQVVTTVMPYNDFVVLLPMVSG